ncbi:hypothetical protein [Qipengyuania sp. SM2507]
MTHRLVADVDPALRQQVFHVPQRQRKADVHHHHQADYLGRRVEIAKRAGWFLQSGHRPALADPPRSASRCICSDSAVERDGTAANPEHEALEILIFDTIMLNGERKTEQLVMALIDGTWQVAKIDIVDVDEH